MSCKEFALDNLVSILAVPVSKPLDAVPTGIESLAGLNADADAVTIGSYALADTLVRLVPDTGKATDTAADNTAGRLHTVTVKCEADCRDDRAVELLRKLERTPSHIVVTSNNGERFGVYATQHTYLCEVEQDAEKTNVTIRIQCMRGLQRIVIAKSIVLDPPSLSLQPGCSGTLKATVLPENTTNKDVEWSTSDPNIASVDGNVKVTAVATITGTKMKDCWIYCKAKDGSGVQAICRCTVANILIGRITLSHDSINKHPGDKITLTADIKPSTATNKSVKWYSSNPGVVLVFGDGSLNATVLANGIGNAKITCAANDGSGVFAECLCTVTQSYVSSITIEPRNITIHVNNSETLKATVKPDNATNKNVIWSSSDTSIASVDSNGKVTAVAEGTCTITCTAADRSESPATATRSVTVSAQLASNLIIKKEAIALPVGSMKKIEVSIIPDNTTNKRLVWESDNENVATVDGNGVVTGVADGDNCTITCTTEDSYGTENPVTATCSVKVFSAVDLGLTSGTLWSPVNVGASAMNDAGDFFSWGETEPKDIYKETTYQPYSGSVLDLEHDAATVNFGENWKTPSKAQLEELAEECSLTFETVDGKDCIAITGPNHNKLYLPEAGYRIGTSYTQPYVYGTFYWTDERTESGAYALNTGNILPITHDMVEKDRYLGICVRPVYVPQESGDSDSSSSQESSSEDSDSSGSDSSEA